MVVQFLDEALEVAHQPAVDLAGVADAAREAAAAGDHPVGRAFGADGGDAEAVEFAPEVVAGDGEEAAGEESRWRGGGRGRS